MLVPLSSQALRILRTMQKIKEALYIFSSSNKAAPMGKEYYQYPIAASMFKGL